MIAIEQQVRCAYRDAVRGTSRKPFSWGGLAGYDQLDAIAQALDRLPTDTETAYLRSLLAQLDRALEVNQPLADDIRAAHTEQASTPIVCTIRLMEHQHQQFPRQVT